MILFNYYTSNIKDSSPKGIVTLDQFIASIRQPKNVEIFKQIQLATEQNDEATRIKLKTHLYSFTPAIIVNTRRAYADIKQFTGLLVLDFDKLETDYCHEFKQYLFEEHRFIIAAWLSASKHGVRALVRIPKVQTVEQYKKLFDGLSFYHMDQYNGHDHAPKNCALPVFQSFDPDILFRHHADQWNTTYTKPIIRPKQIFKPSEDSGRVVEIISSAINKITGNGHPQLRAAAFSLGGYVGSGMISQDEAETLIINLIRTNAYLSKKAHIYEKTALTMIENGSLQPLTL